MKQWITVLNDNHLRLMRVHIGFIIFYILLILLILFYVFSDKDWLFPMLFRGFFTLLAFFMPFILLHLLLAIGSKNKMELSRKVSEIVFVLFFLNFPIGTILSIFFFLPKTVWQQPDE